METAIQQDEETRKAVHRLCVHILRCIENKELFPKYDESDVVAMALEVLHLMPAGEWLEAQRAA